MTKRFLSLLAIMLSILMVLVLVACDNSEKEDTNNNGGSSDTEEGGDNNGGSSDTEESGDNNGGNSDTEEPAKTTVTEEEWNKAISLEGINSFTLLFNQIGYKGTVDNERNYSTSYYYSNGICMQKYNTTITIEQPAYGEADEIIFNPYYEIKNVTLYSLSEVKPENGDLFYDFFEYYEENGLSFSSFEYNEETKSYQYDFHKKTGIPPSKINIYFENGLLTEYTLNYEYDSDTHAEKYDVSCKLSGWNSTQIPYPKQVTALFDRYVTEASEAGYVYAYTQQSMPIKSTELVQQLNELLSAINPSGFLYESLYGETVTLLCPTATIDICGTIVSYDGISISTELQEDVLPTSFVSFYDSEDNLCLYISFFLQNEQ